MRLTLEVLLATLAWLLQPALAQDNSSLKNQLTRHCDRFGATLELKITRELPENGPLVARVGPLVARVVDVGEGSPAARAGIKTGDIILRFGDVNTADDLARKMEYIVQALPDGREVPVTIFRDGEKRLLTVTVGPKCQEQKEAEAKEILPSMYFVYLQLMVCAQRLPEFEKLRSRLKDAIKVKEADVPRDQVDAIWKETAENFHNFDLGMKTMNDFALRYFCTVKSGEANRIISPPMEPQLPPLRKKDF